MADQIVEDAGRLYRESVDATRDQREQIRQDLLFSDPSDPQQWDDVEKRAREQDPGGARPCLVHDQCGQYVSNVAGQVEQRPPALHALPVDSGADIKVAEKLDGFFRHIEHASRASQHYARALTSAARAGVGYLIARPEYVDRALGYQEPRISSEGDPLRVVFDPWSVELDGSDATFGFLLTPLSYSEFERKYGKEAPKVSFGDEKFRKIEDRRESVMIAEHWCIEDTTAKLVIAHDPTTGEDVSMPAEDFALAQQRGEPLMFVREYADKRSRVLWSVMSGVEQLAKEAEYPADGIGIVPVYGYVSYVDGRMRYCGIPRRARDPQRAYNYAISEIRAYIAQAPKSPWVVPARAVRGLEQLWDRASVESRAWLPYHDQDADGPIQQPQRMPHATNLANLQAQAEQAKIDIQAAIGMYQANLGAPSNETSGVAIDSRKEQGEASTSHFPSHLGASLSQVGKLCMQMLPRLIDKPRQLRILGIDSAPGSVQVDPQQPEAVQQGPDGISINPNVGRYDVRVVVGASFSTQRQQAQQAYTEMMRAAPAMIPAIGPLWAQSLDVPHADKLAQVLTAIAPDPVKAILSPEDGKQSAQQLQQQVMQLQQALQEAIQHAHDAQAECDQMQAQMADKGADAQAQQSELELKRYDAETKRIQVAQSGLDAKLQAVQTQITTIQQALQQFAADEAAEMQAKQAEAGETEEPGEGEETAAQQAQENATLAALQDALVGIAQQVAVMVQANQAIAQAAANRPPQVVQFTRDANGDLAGGVIQAAG